jgi:molybdopterin synthase catalytic subunit
MEPKSPFCRPSAAAEQRVAGGGGAAPGAAPAGVRAWEGELEGGCKCRVQLADEEVSVRAARAFCVVPSAGGTVLFEGTTRDRDRDGRPVLRLVYEAYESMAVAEMRRLAQLAATRWPLHAIYMAHRLGVCPVAEGSVVIAVSSTHRAEAFHACEFLIDGLKARVPIWKQEWILQAEAREEGWWRVNCPRCAADPRDHHAEDASSASAARNPHS